MTDNWQEYSYFPITRPHLEKYAEDQQSVFWTADEINYAQDTGDFAKLKPEEQHFLTFILAFFAQADGLINENLMDRFQRELRIYKEATHFYVVQAHIEQVHNKTYSILVMTLINEQSEREKVLDGIQNFPAVKNIADWATDWMANVPYERDEHQLWLRYIIVA